MRETIFCVLLFWMTAAGCKPATVTSSLSVTANKFDPVIMVSIRNNADYDLFTAPDVFILTSDTDAVKCNSSSKIYSAQKYGMHQFQRLKPFGILQINIRINDDCPNIPSGEHRFELTMSISRYMDRYFSLQEKYFADPLAPQAEQISKELHVLVKKLKVMDISETFYIRRP